MSLNCNGEFEESGIKYYEGQRGDEEAIFTDCRSEEGVTVGLVDAIITLFRVLRKRDLSGTETMEALKDLGQDEDFLWFCLKSSAPSGVLNGSDAIIQALENEIEWSKGNVHLTNLTQDSVDWFIKGLEQAKYLILEASRINDFHDPIPNDNLPKNRPGYMGDYGGIPHGPFDL